MTAIELAVLRGMPGSASEENCIHGAGRQGKKDTGGEGQSSGGGGKVLRLTQESWKSIKSQRSGDKGESAPSPKEKKENRRGKRNSVRERVWILGSGENSSFRNGKQSGSLKPRE